jgi:hypothetical protein
MTTTLPATNPTRLTDLAKIALWSLSYRDEICHRRAMTCCPFFVESAKIRQFGAARRFTSEPCQLCQPTCHLATSMSRPK